MTYVSIVNENLIEIVENLMRISIRESNKKLQEIRKIEKKIKNEKNPQHKKELENQKNQLEKETIPFWYKNLMRNLNRKLENISISQINEEEFIEPSGICEAIAIGLQFKRTQLRKFFSEIKHIKTSFQSSKIDTKKIKVQVVSLIPKLAYAASPNRNLIDNYFYQFMKILLENLRKELTYENFKKFEQIFEAIIAYHTYHHPKED